MRSKQKKAFPFLVRLSTLSCLSRPDSLLSRMKSHVPVELKKRPWCCDVIELIAFCLYFASSCSSSPRSTNFLWKSVRASSRRKIPCTAKMQLQWIFLVDSLVICYLSLKLCKKNRFTRNLKWHFYWMANNWAEFIAVHFVSYIIHFSARCIVVVNVKPEVCWRWQRRVERLSRSQQRCRHTSNRARCCLSASWCSWSDSRRPCTRYSLSWFLRASSEGCWRQSTQRPSCQPCWGESCSRFLGLEFVVSFRWHTKRCSASCWQYLSAASHRMSRCKHQGWCLGRLPELYKEIITL